MLFSDGRLGRPGHGRRVLKEVELLLVGVEKLDRQEGMTLDVLRVHVHQVQHKKEGALSDDLFLLGRGLLVPHENEMVLLDDLFQQEHDVLTRGHHSCTQARLNGKTNVDKKEQVAYVRRLQQHEVLLDGHVRDDGGHAAHACVLGLRMLDLGCRNYTNDEYEAHLNKS